ncbi:unnamed protein product [Dicrocoelium dendriticum]|nr:unnamed protein product [Dicrocoelium dendriticum]
MQPDYNGWYKQLKVSFLLSLFYFIRGSSFIPYENPSVLVFADKHIRVTARRTMDAFDSYGPNSQALTFFDPDENDLIGGDTQGPDYDCADFTLPSQSQTSQIEDRGGLTQKVCLP